MSIMKYLLSFLFFLFIHQANAQQIAFEKEFKSYAVNPQSSPYKNIFDKYSLVDSTYHYANKKYDDATLNPNCYVKVGDSIRDGIIYKRSIFLIDLKIDIRCYTKTPAFSWIKDGMLKNSIYQEAIIFLMAGKKISAENLFESAKIDMRNKRYDDACTKFLILTSIDKSYLDVALNNIGLCLYDQKQYRAAGFYLQKAIELFPNQYLAYLNMGTVAKMIKDDAGLSNEAYYFKKAYELAPANDKTIYNYATILMYDYNFNFDKAETLLKTSIKLAPQQPLYQTTLARLYVKQAQNTGLKENDLYQKAIETANKAININNKYSDAYLVKARAFYMLYQSELNSQKRINMDSVCTAINLYYKSGGTDKDGQTYSNLCVNYGNANLTQVKNINELIPVGWKLQLKTEDDFNQDGLTDVAMLVFENNPQKIKSIIRYDTPQQLPGTRNYNKGIFYILLGTKDKKYGVAVIDEKLTETATGYYDNVYTLSSLNGVLKLKRICNDVISIDVMRYQQNNFYIIGQDYSSMKQKGSVRRGKPLAEDCQETFSLNYNTKQLSITKTIKKTGKKESQIINNLIVEPVIITERKPLYGVIDFDKYGF
ncbi:tetratricopeptide repeat protein [Pedobacter punctiformis]|uniref:Tetratricopeptide repeat protein n=1 Tax=Pedobacter punctiformis TaxID=3004097 RepID=A0ABT4LBF7_9SPHI|nr:tetratricopeptide repeat protein [Pedobacter sp. HCMS5-2]MCZ4244139.1 tetratricopeptide repeat protein [Pedobacter sp. HCMS5-2]